MRRSNSSSRTSLLCNDSGKAVQVHRSAPAARITKGERSPYKEMEGLNISFVGTLSKKSMKKTNSLGAYIARERVSSSSVSSGCFSFSVKGGGCRVGACEELEVYVKRSLTAVDDCMTHRVSNEIGEEMLCKKNIRRGKSVEQESSKSATCFLLPDDVVGMILARLPLTSLLAARCVCKKWRSLTTTPHFIQMRHESSCKSPWLFLFGITRSGCHAGEIHALDVSADRWHRVTGDKLKNRFLFSVASVGPDVYIVGGCSTSSSTTERSSIRTHKGVLVFSPLTNSWRKIASMRSARSGPVLGVFEIGSACNIFHTQSDCQNLRILKSHNGVSEEYGNYRRFSVRHRLRDAFLEDDISLGPRTKPYEFARLETGYKSKFTLIAVGGHGRWDEPLDSGEIYDPTTDRWVGIANLPGDFGTVCSGVVCGQMFYVYSEANKLAGYDLERGFWVIIQTARPPPRLHDYNPKLVSCMGRLFLLCVSWCERDGQLSRREKAVRKLWELNFTQPSWYEVSRHPDAPMDSSAVFVADDSRIYGVEMFSIFGQVLSFVTGCRVSDAELNWTRISKKHVTHDTTAASCMSKSIAVVHL